jgi:hypothetical protein
MKDMLPLIEQVARSAKPFLVIAEEVEGEALATLVVSRLKGTLPWWARLARPRNRDGIGRGESWATRPAPSGYTSCGPCRAHIDRASVARGIVPRDQRGLTTSPRID